jgi:hypothetical protein
MNIPTDSTLPVDIYHSSVRDYVSDPSNCNLAQVHDIPSPHPLLALSSFRLMIKDIPESMAILDALSQLETHSHAMQPQDPKILKESLGFLVQPPQPLSVLISLLWIRGDRSLDLQSWLQMLDGCAWLQTQGGDNWLQTQEGMDWLQTQGGRDWLQTSGGKYWLDFKGGRDWQQAQRDHLLTGSLQTGYGQSQLQMGDVQTVLLTLLRTHAEKDRPQTWLQTMRGRVWLQIMRTGDWLQIPRMGDWLQTSGGRHWLQTTDGRDWLQTTGGRDWLQTRGGQNWLQEMGGREWLLGMSGRNWLQTSGGRDWLQMNGGREWLQKTDGQDWLKTSHGSDWLQTQGGQDWLQISHGRDWLQTQGGRDWLQTSGVRDWLQTQGGREWLQTPDGRAWQSTPAASVWVTMKEFSSTVEAISQYTTFQEFFLLPAFQVVEHFKSLPDFLMFPTFLALRRQDHSTSASPGLSPPNREIIHAMNAFMTFAGEAHKQSLLASDALRYACHYWAIHLSRAPNPWDGMLKHTFQAFWNRHLLSWLQLEWCLRGLRSCLVVLSEVQELAKNR